MLCCSRECKLFSEAREIKAKGAEIDRVIAAGGNVVETIILLQSLDQEVCVRLRVDLASIRGVLRLLQGKKYSKFSDLLAALREAKIRRMIQLAGLARDRLAEYLESSDCKVSHVCRPLRSLPAFGPFLTLSGLGCAAVQHGADAGQRHARRGRRAHRGGRSKSCFCSCASLADSLRPCVSCA